MTEYTIFLLAFAASAAAPGPEIAALLSRSLSGGMLSSVPLALGIILGKLLMLSAPCIALCCARRQKPFQSLKYTGMGIIRSPMNASGNALFLMIPQLFH